MYSFLQVFMDYGGNFVFESRDVINASLWLALTGNSSFMGKNYKPQSLARRRFNGLPNLSRQGQRHVDSFSVARVRPRTSKGITDLLLLNLVWLNATCPSKKLHRRKRIGELFSRLESRSLSELTRQIAPPTRENSPGPDTVRIDRLRALSWFGGWWCMAVLSWWSDLSG